MWAGLSSTEKVMFRDAETLLMVEGSIRTADTGVAVGIPRCLGTHARTYALHRDLGGLHAIPLSWRDR